MSNAWLANFEKSLIFFTFPDKSVVKNLCRLEKIKKIIKHVDIIVSVIMGLMKSTKFENVAGS